MLRQFVMFLAMALMKKPDEIMLYLIILGSPVIYVLGSFLIKNIPKLVKVITGLIKNKK